MSKQKTRKSITRRFRITKKGKVLRRQGFRRHLNVKKSSRKKRKLKRVIEMKPTYAKKIKKAVGYRKRVKKASRRFLKSEDKTKKPKRRNKT